MQQQRTENRTENGTEKERNGGKKVWGCKSAAKNFSGRKLQNGKGQASTKWTRMETHERYKIKINIKTK